MSEFNGLVKGRFDYIASAITEYELALDIAQIAYKQAKQLSIIETRKISFLWLWERDVLVKDIILKDYKSRGWRTQLPTVYSEYYPDLLSHIQANLISEAWKSEYIEIKKMIVHNTGVWLTPDQAEWVNVWSQL
jgi:hypothetical protein